MSRSEGPANPSDPAGSPPPTVTPGRVALAAFTCALWVSLAEFVPAFVAPYGRVAVRLPGDFAWMIPLAHLVVFGLVAGGVVAASRARRRPVTRAPVAGALAGLVTLSLGAALELIHPAALVLLAVGVGAQAHRLGSRPVKRPHVLPVLAVVATLLVVGINARLAMAEQRWESTWRGWLPVARSGSPNIVLVILDTVRGASLSFVGDLAPQSPWPTASTPVLDSLAGAGVVFTRAIAPSPWTLPSHASMFTGQWPTTLWGANRRGAEWLQGFDVPYPTVAEILARRGYMTGGFVGNLAFTPRETGLNRGFLAYQDYPRTPGQILLSTALGRRIETSGLWRRPLKHHELLNRKHGDHVVDGFLAWREEEGDRPYFAFLNLFDAHEPVFPPDAVKDALPDGSRWDEFDHFAGLLTGNGALRSEKWAMDPAEQEAHAAAYNDGIRRLDAQVGRLLRELEATPSRNPTVVIVTSDHGEQLGERSLYDHNNSLYLPALHVPLLVIGPGVEGGRRVTEVVSLRDVAATVLALAGVDAGAVGVGGASLDRFWRPDAATVDTGRGPGGDASSGAAVPTSPPPAFATLSRGSDNRPWYPVSWGPAMHTLVDADYQYILNGDGSEELYHLPTDPGERANVVDDPAHAPARDRMRATMSRQVEGLPDFRGAVEHPGPPVSRQGGRRSP